MLREHFVTLVPGISENRRPAVSRRGEVITSQSRGSWPRDFCLTSYIMPYHRGKNLRIDRADLMCAIMLLLYVLSADRTTSCKNISNNY